MDPALVNTNRPGHLPATVGIIGTPAPVTPGRVRSTVRTSRCHILVISHLVAIWICGQPNNQVPGIRCMIQ